MNPIADLLSRLLLGLAAVLALVAGGFFYGQHAATAKCQMEQRTAIQAAQATQDRIQAQYQQAANSLSDLQASQHETAIENTQAVERIVVRPVYRNVCLDADGLRIANRALAASTSPGQPAATVPTP